MADAAATAFTISAAGTDPAGGDGKDTRTVRTEDDATEKLTKNEATKKPKRKYVKLPPKPPTLRELKKRQVTENPELLKEMTAEDIFNIFDDDESGLMNFEEFHNMLPRLGIRISDAKAYRYFLICDTDRSGEIDVDEFKVALYACDPTSGNPIGFAPSSYLSPLDAFETFDAQHTGFVDEDEFYFAMEYLGLKMTDFRHENYFASLDINNSGKIDYIEFRKVFIKICDIKKELEQRDVEVPSITKRAKLEVILEALLDDEEDKERRALAETKRYKAWVFSVKDKQRFLRRAQWRSYHELRGALDSAGQVYLFGTGSQGQFASGAVETLKSSSDYKFFGFQKIVDMWRDRVQPQQLIDRLRIQRRADEQDDRRQAQKANGIELKGMVTTKNDKIDPFEEASQSKFIGLNVSTSTAGLWGRRIHHVAISESVIFAISDLGEVFAWGGSSLWWHDIQADSIYQSKWRGDTTPRSQLLLGTTERDRPREIEKITEEGPNMGKRTIDDDKEDWIKVVAKYYNMWQAPPATGNRLKYIERTILSKIKYDVIVFSLECRGLNIRDRTLYEVLEDLHDAILLEKKLLGEKAHKSIKEIEENIKDLRRRRKFKAADKMKDRIVSMWVPLREVQAEAKAKDQAEKAAIMNEALMKGERDYDEWRERAVFKREVAEPELSPRGNSLHIDISGMTPRGADMHTPRGYQSGAQVAAGSAHALLLHRSGQLYSWGVGISGRLGLDDSELGEPQNDAAKPKLVQALDGRPVIRVSCGFSHSGAILSGGELYMWGSAAAGKCGVGPDVEKSECYVAAPTRVLVGGHMNRKVVKLSCGASHSAAITDNGQLFMFGLGDGGRLGQGYKTYNTLYEPTLCTALLHERVASVSCGSATTVAVTEVRKVMNPAENAKEFEGGRVYVCGSANTLGYQIDTFTYVQELDGIPIKMASAGFQHIAVVSASGIMYCWGRNNGVCCGTAPHAGFIEYPTAVQCLYTEPENLALGKRACQSSTYDNRHAYYALNGEKSGKGLKNCTCTQQDQQAWWEVDLGTFAVIQEIRIWNRTDEPLDPIQPRDMFTSRLTPFWVMISSDPFSKETGLGVFKYNLHNAQAKTKFADNVRVSTWKVPSNIQGRYIRIQLEGFNYLHLAEVEVFGNWGIQSSVGRVSYVAAGRDVTVAVVRPSPDPKDFDAAYRRSVFVDSGNADILRQLEAYNLEYDKYGRGEMLLNKKCIICRGSIQCEACALNQEYAFDISRMPPGLGGRRRRLDEMHDFLVNEAKPELIMPYVPRAERPTKWQTFKETWMNRLKRAGILRGNIQVARSAHKTRNLKASDASLPPIVPRPTPPVKTTVPDEDSVVSGVTDLDSGGGGSSVAEDVADNASEISSSDAGSETSSKRARRKKRGKGKHVPQLQDIDEQSVGSEMSFATTSQYSAGERSAAGHKIREPYPTTIKADMDASIEILQVEKAERQEREAREKEEARLQQLLTMPRQGNKK